MLKWIGIGLVVCGCTAMGMTLGSDLQKRVMQLREMRKMAVVLQGEIRYGNATMNEAFHHTASRVQSPFREVLEQCACQMEEFRGEGLADIFRQNAEKELKGSALKKEDRELLYNLGGNLGYLDTQMQMNSLEMFLEQVNELCIQAVAEQKNKTKIYHYLGLMGGLFLAIVLI